MALAGQYSQVQTAVIMAVELTNMSGFAESANLGGSADLSGSSELLSLLTDDLFIVPMEYSFLLSNTEWAARIILFGVIASFGVLSNLTCIFVMVNHCDVWVIYFYLFIYLFIIFLFLI